MADALRRAIATATPDLSLRNGYAEAVRESLASVGNGDLESDRTWPSFPTSCAGIVEVPHLITDRDDL